MGNVVENNILKSRLIGKTIRDIGNNSIALVIPKEFARELDIENSKVSMFLLKDFDDNKHLVVSKHYDEITIEQK
jgi:hypothetical protein